MALAMPKLLDIPAGTLGANPHPLAGGVGLPDLIGRLGLRSRFQPRIATGVSPWPLVFMASTTISLDRDTVPVYERDSPAVCRQRVSATN